MRSRRAWTRFVQAATQPSGSRPTAEDRISGHRSGRFPRPGRTTALRRWTKWAKWKERATRSATTPGTEPGNRDLRLLPATAAAWVTAAGVTRLDAATALLCAGVLAVLATCAGIGCFLPDGLRPIRRLVLPCVVPLAVAAMVAVPAAAAIEARTAGPVLSAVQDRASITAVLKATSDAVLISADRFKGADRFLVEAVLTAGTVNGTRFAAHTPVVVIGPASWRQVASSDSIRAAGRLLPTEPGDRAGALLMAETGPLVSRSADWTTYPAQVRKDFVELTSRVAGEGSLLPGMVIGDRSTLDESVEQNMQTTGMTHLTAVSGANCTYMLAFVFLGARALRLPRLLAAVLGILALIGFVILVQPEPSVLRAAVMGGLGVAAVLTGRGRVPLALLLLTVVVLLVADPWLTASYAFMLSVAAASGLMLFGPILATRLCRFMPAPAAQLLAVPIAAQLFCTPILILLQPALPLYSVPANLVATPVVPMVTIVGMAAVALLVIAEPLAMPLVLVAGWGADWVEVVAEFFGSAPGAALPWMGGPLGAAVTGALSLAIVLAVVFGPRLRAVSRKPQQTTRRRGHRPAGGRIRAPALLWLAGSFALGLGAVIAWPVGPDTDGAWRVAACDVGQGDAFVLRTGEREVILVDTGPEPDDVDACLDRLAVTTVQLLVLTHLHADHYAGIEGVFRDRTVQRILYSSSEPALPTVVTEASQQRVMPERLVEGMQGEHGDGGSYGRVNWTVLWPGDSAQADSENNSSAVLEIIIDSPDAADVTILMTGDLEEDAAQTMLRANPALVERGVHILKVAHHGALNGGLELAHAVRPQLALISAGRDNDYGHPHPSIITGLSAAGITVARTDELGTFLVSVQDNLLRIRR
ncbi:ComEC/Rec2 family competence protein [Arthrobacter sp. TMN-50]